MFFKSRFIGFLAVVFLMIGLFNFSGRSAYQAGWAEGYGSGRSAAIQQQSAEAKTVPAEGSASAVQTQANNGPYGYYGHGHSHFGWFFGGFLRLLFFFFLINLLVKMFFWRRWRRRWHRHGRGPWHHKHYGPPWKRDRRHGRHRSHNDNDDERSDKERYYDEYGPDSPVVDL